ncbi:hypothetical protein FRC02_000758 [Tulasnella sp. 418]|nr:hypothetical protein FRC02_000758 [Tulasnella sp. 418]
MAAIQITAPSSSFWWVADSQNLFAWTCGAANNGGYTNFTVLIQNQNPTVLQGPLALIAVQWDYDCSILFQPVQSLTPATGYTLTFADVFNQTNVIATSEPFEVKAKGSAYAPQPSNLNPVTATVTGAATGTGASAAATQSAANNGALVSRDAAFGFMATLLTLVGAAVML